MGAANIRSETSQKNHKFTNVIFRVKNVKDNAKCTVGTSSISCALAADIASETGKNNHKFTNAIFRHQPTNDRMSNRDRDPSPVDTITFKAPSLTATGDGALGNLQQIQEILNSCL